MKKTQYAFIVALMCLVGIGMVFAGGGREATETARSLEAKIILDSSSFQWGEPGNREWWAEVTRRFNESQDRIEVRGSQIPHSSYGENVLIRMIAGNPPDIVVGAGSAWDRMGHLEPINNWLDIEDINRRYYPPQSEVGISVNENGDTFRLATQINTYLLFYNKAMFDEAGLDVPTTPEAFLEAARRLTLRDAQGNVTQYGYAAATPPQGASVLLYWGQKQAAFGGRFTEDREFTINTPENVAATKWLKEVYDAGVQPTTATIEGYRQMFWEGRVAMVYDVSALLGMIRSANPGFLEVLGTAPGMNNSAQVYSFGIGVPSNIPEYRKEAAMEFLKFVASEEVHRLTLELVNTTPAMKGIVDDTWIADNPYMDAIVNSLNTALPYIPFWHDRYRGQLDPILRDTLGEIIFQNRPVEDALQAAEARLRSELNL